MDFCNWCDVMLFFWPLCVSQIFARTEADTHVLAYSEGALVPCSITADMTLAQVTFEVVKVRHSIKKKKKWIPVCDRFYYKLSSKYRSLQWHVNTVFISTSFPPYCMFQIPGGSTDCTLPITWATENGKAIDVFIILTNNPLWAFTASPVESLKKHRQVNVFFHVCIGLHRVLIWTGTGTRFLSPSHVTLY